MAKMRSLQFHTGHGETHEVGDVYEVPDDQVDNLVALKFAERVDLDAPAPAQPSQPVDVMTTDDVK